jgi:tyrosyl-tRNA synthetase
MKLSEELQWRGFVNQMTYADITELDNSPISFYWGVDPSADSMHIGQLAMAMMIKHFIKAGHKATLLVGGATGMIGDPDGKAEERDLKSDTELQRNVAGISSQYKNLFDGIDFDMVNNFDWFQGIGFLNFLRDVGKYVPMSQMLGREFVQSRLGDDGKGISYAEFSYSLIQGYDFLHLSREKGITLQVAGADQWGNSIAGVDLIRRLDAKEAHVWTAPLILNKTTGKKFGKSEDGAVWLDENQTSIFKFYQFWLNVDDSGSIDYLKIFTMLGRDEILEIERQSNENPSGREAQKTLAHEVTKIVHGEARTASVEKVTAVLFGGLDFSELSSEDLDVLADEILTAALGTSVVEALVGTGTASSNGDARRLIESGAVSVNGEKVAEDFAVNEASLIKKGKNNFILVR